MWKKIITILLACTLAAGLLSGCSKAGGDGEKEKETKKGRYVEREITLPEGAGKSVGMVWKDEKLTLYSGSAENNSYQSYVYENGSWSEPAAEEWLGRADQGGNREIYKVFCGRDGNLYALVFDSNEGGTSSFHLVTKAEDGTAKDVMPEAFLSGDEQAGVTSACVLEDGTIGIGTYNGTVEFYKDGKQTASIETMFPESPDSSFFEAGKNAVCVIGADEKEIEFYDAKTLEKKSTVTARLNICKCSNQHNKY